MRKSSGKIAQDGTRQRSLRALRNACFAAAGLLACFGTVYAFQKPFRQYHGVEYYSFETPPDADEKTEFQFARLMFPGGWNDGYRGRFDGDFRLGLSLWTQDYPRADRHFSQAVKRLTRIHVRSVEQPVNLDEDEEFDQPWLYAVQVGEWGLTAKQGKELREYLLRGGFLVTDDFWGAEQWEIFRRTMDRVLPGHAITDIGESDPVMHVLYDIEEKDRTFIPGSRHLRRGPNGSVAVIQPPDSEPAWRAMYDDRHRMVVAANYNTDVGDAWEFADVPYYPEPMTALAYRYGINYVVYAMTH